MQPIFFDEVLGASPVTLLTAMRRWYNKANALAAGWKQEFGTNPPKTVVFLALAVAQLESKCGDIWPNAHNWGCIQQRVPTSLEKRVLIDAGVPPSPRNVDAGQTALEAAVAAGTIPANHDGILWCDSDPEEGYYWVFFQSFKDDETAAQRFVHVLAANRPTCRQALESPAASEQELATGMYLTKYFVGMHKGDTAEGRQANINDYAAAIRSWTPSIRGALVTWTAGAPPPSDIPNPDQSSDIWVQWALNRLGLVPPLTEDGWLGPMSRAAIKAFQKKHSLVVDGVAGPVTRAVIANDLKK